jgi:hypothetical protein
VAVAIAALPLHRYRLSWRATVCSWVTVSLGAVPAANQVLCSIALAVILGLVAGRSDLPALGLVALLA